jgi:excisionase family DNA binding protein
MSNEIITRPLLSIRETSELLGVTERQVRRLISRGDLPAVQLGGKGAAVRIDRDEIVAWLHSSPEGDAA